MYLLLKSKSGAFDISIFLRISGNISNACLKCEYVKTVVFVFMKMYSPTRCRPPKKKTSSEQPWHQKTTWKRSLETTSNSTFFWTDGWARHSTDKCTSWTCDHAWATWWNWWSRTRRRGGTFGRRCWNEDGNENVMWCEVMWAVHAYVTPRFLSFFCAYFSHNHIDMFDCWSHKPSLWNIKNVGIVLSKHKNAKYNVLFVSFFVREKTKMNVNTYLILTPICRGKFQNKLISLFWNFSIGQDFALRLCLAYQAKNSFTWSYRKRPPKSWSHSETFQVWRYLLSRGRRRILWHVDAFGDFCYVFRTCGTFFVPGAALWTCLSSFLVASAAFQMCRVACFLRIASARLREVVTKW